MVPYALMSQKGTLSDLTLIDGRMAVMPGCMLEDLETRDVMTSR